MKSIWDIKSKKGKSIFGGLKVKPLGNSKYEGARYSNPLIKPNPLKGKKIKVVDIFKIKAPMKDELGSS